MDYFSLWLNILIIAAQGCLQLIFSCQFTGKRPEIRLIIYLIALYAIDSAVSFLHLEELAVFFMLAALYGINRFILSNGRASSCATAIVAVYVTELSFGLLNSLEIIIFPQLLGTILLNILISVASLSAMLLCLLFYRMIVRKYSLKSYPSELYVWILVPPGLFFFVTELYILKTAYGNTDIFLKAEIGASFTLQLVQLLGLAALFATLFACQRTCDGFRAQSELAAVSQAANAQKTYIAQAKMRYEQTKAFRHDVNNHLSVLAGLIAGGKLEQAKSYLEELKAVTGKLSFPYHSGNPVVDILLEDKLALLSAEGAEVQVSLTFPEHCGVDEFDLCVIFSNALDNAVQACKLIDEKKWIHIEGRQQGDFYFLEFVNPCDPAVPIVTGTGLANIRAIAEKYGGAMTMEKSHSRFYLSVLLNIWGHSDNRSLQTS